MKYTIMGFSQIQAIEYNLDLIDLMLIRWFVDFKDSGEMKYKLLMMINITG